MEVAAMEVAWARLKAHEVRALAEQNAVVVFPVASIEQHGPHLPVMTDTRLGEEVALRAARKAQATRPVVVAPVLWCALSEHHMAFGGTLILSHATFRAVIRDLVTSAIRHGFRDVLISNSHGGNIIALQQILDELSPELPATIVATTYWLEGGPALAAHLEGQDQLLHACEAETSMMMALEPDLVDMSDLAAVASTPGPRFLTAGAGSYRWRPLSHVTANGVWGDPSIATPEKGEALLEAAAEAVAALIVDPETWAPVNDLRSG